MNDKFGKDLVSQRTQVVLITMVKGLREVHC